MTETETKNIIEQEEAKVWGILASVPDPEVPVLSVIDLGIVRAVELSFQSTSTGEAQPPFGVTVKITPTYSGCPAMDMIRTHIRMELLAHGYQPVKIETVLSPAWTTDWMSENGKEKLKAFGIAPPNPKQQVCDIRLFHDGEAIQCPRCNSYHTQLISQFGSTACKAMYRCLDCREPLDYFKYN